MHHFFDWLRSGCQRHPPLIKAPFFENGCMPSFFLFVFFYFFCLDIILGNDERKLAAALFWGVSKGLFGTYKSFLVYWLNSISDAFQLSCAVFSKHGLTIFLDALSICLSRFLLWSRVTSQVSGWLIPRQLQDFINLNCSYVLYSVFFTCTGLTLCYSMWHWTANILFSLQSFSWYFGANLFSNIFPVSTNTFSLLRFIIPTSLQFTFFTLLINYFLHLLYKLQNSNKNQNPSYNSLFLIHHRIKKV